MELQEAQAALEAANTQIKEANDKLAAKDAELARYREAEVAKDALAFVEATLPKTIEGIAPAVWELTRARLTESLKAKAPVKDGALDKDAYKTLIESDVKTEVLFLAKLTEGGQIMGMGGAPLDDGTGRAQLIEAHKRNFRDQGYTDDQATRMAEAAVH